VGVALGGRTGEGEVSFITISWLAAIGIRCRSMQLKVTSSFSIDWSQRLGLSLLQSMEHRGKLVYALIDKWYWEGHWHHCQYQ